MMDERINSLFPIGTVVKIKDAVKKLMIVGILQCSESKEYDYMGLLYPEGYLTENHIFLFNHEDIEEVMYVGYMDVEHQVFRTTLIDMMKGKTK